MSCRLRHFPLTAWREQPGPLTAHAFRCLTRACVEECQKTGSLKETSIKHCMLPTDGTPAGKSWYTHEPLYLQWKDWNCKSECRYHCMMERENERAQLGLLPVKYHGKWPLKRASVFQVVRLPLSTELLISFTPAIELDLTRTFCFSFSFHFLIRLRAFIPRNLYLLLSLLSLLLCNSMGGYRFSSCFITSYHCGPKLTRPTMNTLAFGTFMGSWPWIHGSGVPYITVGMFHPRWWIFACL
jgi:hypothetical protein